jgi:(p)ppGpp synthase/HD superfamily hydrolase
MSTLEKAIEIAARAHTGQVQKNGLPYILHPLRIMFQVDLLEDKMVAVLHDVVEDTDVTLDDLRQAGFSEEVVEGVRLMTRVDGQDYGEYIEAIKANPIARNVKLADMRNNIDLLRIPELNNNDLKRSRKYHKYIRFLEK